MRDIYASLHASNPTTYPQPFPLVPTVGGVSQVNLSGVLKAGSGVYVRCVQPPRGGSVTLLFGAPGPTALPSVMAAQFEVIRVR